MLLEHNPPSPPVSSPTRGKRSHPSGASGGGSSAHPADRWYKWKRIARLFSYCTMGHEEHGILCAFLLTLFMKGFVRLLSVSSVSRPRAPCWPLRELFTSWGQEPQPLAQRGHTSHPMVPCAALFEWMNEWLERTYSSQALPSERLWSTRKKRQNKHS